MNRVTRAYLDACADLQSPLRAAGRRMPLEPAFARVYAQAQLPRPLFVPEALLRQAAADLHALQELVMAVPGRLFGGDLARVCAALGIDERVARLACAGADIGTTPLYSRPDMYFDGESFKVLELNTGSELGGPDWAAINRGFLAVPEFRAFADQYGLGYVDIGEKVAAYLRELAAPVTGGADPVVALIDISANMDTYRDNYTAFVEHMATHGIDIRVAHIRDLGSRDGKLTLDGTPVDVAMRYFTVEEICGAPQAEEWLAPVLRAHREGRTVFFASLDYAVYANKGLLAMVSEMRGRGELSADEAAVVDRILPWTRRVTPDMWEHCRTNQERLLLKPSASSGGAGVTTGWDVTPDEWEAAFDKALGSPFVVQERVVPELEPMPHGDGFVDWLAVWGFFTFAQGYAGMCVRALPDEGHSIVNLATGGALTCAFSYPGE